MQTVHGHRETPAAWAEGSVATLGVFDGVHLGHLAVLDAAVGAGRGRGLPAVAITFDRHPRQTLAGSGPPLIVPLERRLRLIGQRGFERCLVLRFDAALAAMPARRFAEEVLLSRLGARTLVLGHDCRFGQGGEGDADWLAQRRTELGIEALSVGPLAIDGTEVSSTAIREAILSADLARAARLLGRLPAIDGEVVRGAGRGRTLGFPTANVDPTGYLLPPRGVYLATATPAGEGPYPALVNIGVRPTFGDAGRTSVEAYLAGYDGDLYGRRLELALARRLRDERRFDSAEALAAQIRADLAALEATTAGRG